jgi:hypothetical protein
VHNHADVAVGVHLHGLELESWADGVPGWSGTPDAARPAIQPGATFTVRVTPPRAGTFMYHAHSEPGHQLALGLYGAFIVLEPGQTWDPERDRLFLLGSLGPGDDPPTAVNGEHAPGPIDLRAGSTYRLRFMHISPSDGKRVRLLSNEQAVACGTSQKTAPISRRRRYVRFRRSSTSSWARRTISNGRLRSGTTCSRSVPPMTVARLHIREMLRERNGHCDTWLGRFRTITLRPAHP